jgi:sigma-B regulation protein RsbU (phosphoserine phosphatase)
MKLRSILYLLGSFLAFLLVFIIDVIRKNVELNIAGLGTARELLIIGAFVLLYIFLEARKIHHALTPIKRIGLVMIYSVLITLFCLAVTTLTEDNFDIKDNVLIPLTYWQLFIATAVSIALGVFVVLVFRIVRGLVLFKAKRETQRNFSIYLGLTFAASASVIPLDALESSVLTNILVGFALLFAVIISFRLPWIVYLTKREKIFGLIYGFVLFLVLVGLNIMVGSERGIVGKSLLYHSYPLNRFVFLTTLFANIYFGVAFISTLFHLPTAEAFERKTTEVTSLHNLGKLVTQAFDFDQLVETVTSMTLQVCEAKSCWLEILQPTDERAWAGTNAGVHTSTAGDYVVRLVGRKNIAQSDIDILLSAGNRTLRDEVMEQRKPIVVDDVQRDSRFATLDLKIGSLVVVPLVSHTGMTGILYATKDAPYSFFRDDVDVISAFADQATIAIENSRLIQKSIERERLLREMAVAQEMQRRLLPQTLPSYPTFEIDASSIPAFEVGGDYYDVVELEGGKVGIVVGDVSGKGVSAAFYMSEVKGIFQSLSRLYPSPREFMLKANEALSGSIDKHSFVSLIYAVMDVATGTLTLARAGHCPLLHLSGKNVTYVRPGGMGLGLSVGRTFEASMEEYTIQLRAGDVCVFYTDGVTEARRGDDEYGYERLLQTVVSAQHQSASALKETILQSVKAHADKPENDDDITIVVVKWLGDATHV